MTPMNSTLTRALLALTLLSPAVLLAESGPSSRALTFDVFLDDSRIGVHRFDIGTSDSGSRVVRSEASFDVKFLFFTAYRYRHQNSEVWKGDCLVGIDAVTDANGKQTAVQGARSDAGFSLRTAEAARTLPDCVMTFAYWNPAFLREPRLLNPQTGEYLDVEVTERAAERVEVGGREVIAIPYDIRAKDMEITVWYSSDDEWLALESVAKGDRIIRYELS